jgi:peptidoglycan/LPS O-acetylase OafA/YrhL
VLGAVLLGVLAWLAVRTKGDLDQWDGLLTLVRCMPEFLLGTLLYFAFRDYGQRVWLCSDLAVFIALATILMCLHLGAPDLLIVSFFAAFVLLAASNAGAFAKIVNIGPLTWLGEISYSLYLIHGFVQFAASKGLGAFGIQHSAALSSGESLTLLMLMLGLCIFCASATYRGVETVWRKRLRAALSDPQDARSAPTLRSQAAS